jgi:hypothetical protein
MQISFLSCTVYRDWSSFPVFLRTDFTETKYEVSWRSIRSLMLRRLTNLFIIYVYTHTHTHTHIYVYKISIGSIYRGQSGFGVVLTTHLYREPKLWKEWNYAFTSFMSLRGLF